MLSNLGLTMLETLVRSLKGTPAQHMLVTTMQIFYAVFTVC